MFKRLFPLLLCLALLLSAMPGVAQEENPYPETLTIFTNLSEHISKTGATSFNDSYVFQEMERITGTHVEWIHPPAGANNDAQINLMAASNSLPDIVVRSNWKSFAGGPALWEEDGIIYDLTEMIPEYMPNYYALISELPYAIKDISVDGKMYFISEIPHGYPYVGPIYRGDWLEKLNLEIPETLDELYDVLVAIKNGDPNGNGQADEWGMSDLSFGDTNFGLYMLLWPFGITTDFMQIDGRVTYGPLEPEFADAMAFVAKLYADGLLDPDYTTQDRNMLDGKFMNDQVGFEFGIQPTKMNSALADTGFKAVGGPNLKLDADSKPYVFHNMYVSYVGPNSDAVITTSCKEPEKALAWMDFLFSEEGLTLSNFGIEGRSFRYEDGVPVYDFSGALELDPGMSEDDLINRYRLVGMSSFPMRQMAESFFSTMHPYSAEAASKWSDVHDASRMLPSLSLSAEETERVNDMLVDIRTYISVQYDRLITGQATVEEIPQMQERLRDLGIEECIAVYQTAYDRYMAE